MKILVLGCGYIGPAVAHDLLSRSSVAQVVLVDKEEAALKKAETKLQFLHGKEKLQFLKCDLTDFNGLLALFAQYDLIAAALPWSSTLPAVKAANYLCKPLVSITRPAYQALEDLKRETQASGNLIVLGCGLEPGLTEILAADAVANLDAIEELHIRCGGLPLKASPPLYYKSLFNSSGLPIEPRSAYAIDAGKLISLPRFSELESHEVEDLGNFEAWHDGMLPWLADWPKLRAANRVTQKTLRWPGFARTVRALESLGLLSKEVIEVNQQQIVPFNLVNAVLRNKTKFTDQDRDFVILNVRANGLKSGKSCQYQASLVDHYDEQTHFTAMARTTGFTLSTLAMLIAQGEIKDCGLLRPEEIFSGPRFNKLCLNLQELGISLEIQLFDDNPRPVEDANPRLAPCEKSSNDHQKIRFC